MARLNKNYITGIKNSYGHLCNLVIKGNKMLLVNKATNIHHPFHEGNTELIIPGNMVEKVNEWIES